MAGYVPKDEARDLRSHIYRRRSCPAERTRLFPQGVLRSSKSYLSTGDIYPTSSDAVVCLPAPEAVDNECFCLSRSLGLDDGSHASYIAICGRKSSIHPLVLGKSSKRDGSNWV